MHCRRPDLDKIDPRSPRRNILSSNRNCRSRHYQIKRRIESMRNNLRINGERLCWRLDRLAQIGRMAGDEVCRLPGQKPDPRSLGALPKALRMGREMGIPLAQMVWRLSTLPCRFLKLPDPTLKIGADASLVLFDPNSVCERNDYADDGIDVVWVHGAGLGCGPVHPMRKVRARVSALRHSCQAP
jgi:hypothetical protein